VANDQLIEERIRARAHRLWEEEGRPEGRAEAHWEQARLIVALEDAQHTILKPVQAPEAEPIELVRNLGEFPTPTDQGEEQTYPSSSSTAGEPLFESTEPTLAAQEQLIAPPSPVGSPLTGPQVKKRGPSTAMMTAMDKPISPQLADAHRTGHEGFPHPALGQDFTPSPTARRAQAGTGARARSTRKGARVDTSRPCVA
jgi:hypothetical protein